MILFSTGDNRVRQKWPVATKTIFNKLSINQIFFLSYLHTLQRQQMSIMHASGVVRVRF